MTMRTHRPLSERFARYIRIADSGCWEWTGARTEHGYGVIGRGRRGEGNVKAHRLAFERFHDVRLTPEQCVCHRCDNPCCVNPEHLFLGTRGDNHTDMRRKGRGSCPPLLTGSRHPKAKLDETKVISVFVLRRQGLTTYRIAERMGVSRATIGYVLNRKTWRHVHVADHFRRRAFETTQRH